MMPMIDADQQVDFFIKDALESKLLLSMLNQTGPLQFWASGDLPIHIITWYENCFF